MYLYIYIYVHVYLYICHTYILKRKTIRLRCPPRSSLLVSSSFPSPRLSSPVSTPFPLLSSHLLSSPPSSLVSPLISPVFSSVFQQLALSSLNPLMFFNLFSSRKINTIAFISSNVGRCFAVFFFPKITGESHLPISPDRPFQLTDIDHEHLQI